MECAAEKIKCRNLNETISEESNFKEEEKLNEESVNQHKISDSVFMSQQYSQERTCIGVAISITDTWTYECSFNVGSRINIEDLHEDLRVEVFWRNDLKWYPGFISSISLNEGEIIKVHVKYDDGEEEMITQIQNEIWRPLLSKRSFPTPSIEQSSEYTALFEIGMQYAKNIRKKHSSKHDINREKGNQFLSAVDFRTLKKNTWINYVIISNFCKALFEKSSNSDDKRFALIDPQVIVYCNESSLRKSLEGVLKNLPIYEVDFFIWPIHNENHWMLCTANILTFTCQLFNPYHPNEFHVDNALKRKTLKGFLRCSSLNLSDKKLKILGNGLDQNPHLSSTISLSSQLTIHLIVEF